MKKKLFFILFLSLFGTQINAQTKNIRGHNIDTTYYVYVIGKISFFPSTEVFNKPDSLLFFCKTFKRLFFLNGLQLSEFDFIKIGLRREDILNGRGEYLFYYDDRDSTKCIQYAKMMVISAILFEINGIEIKESESYSKLSIIKQCDIINIVRKKSFLKKSKIKITTK